MGLATKLDAARLERLLEVGQALVSELDTEPVLRRVLEAARELTGARYAALGVLDEPKRELERFLTSGVDASTHAAIGELPRGRGVLGELIADPRPLRLARVGSHPRSYGFPPDHPRMDTFLGVPVLIRGEAFGNLYLTEKEGGDFDDADEQTLVLLAGWAAIAIENARIYDSLRAQRDELERAASGLEATTAIGRAIGGETDLGRVLELIAKRGRALVDARGLVIALADGDEIEVAVTAGEFDADPLGARMPVHGSVEGEVMTSARPERLHDVSRRVRFGLGEHGVRAAAGLLVPLVFRGRALGVLAAFDRLVGGPEFSEEDERLLAAFAGSAATAVATAKSVAHERLAQALESSEQERRRWARELHDETLQGLGGLRILLTGALRAVSRTQLEDGVHEVLRHIDTEIGNLSALIDDLRPPALDEISLAAALEGLAERVRATHGLEVELRIHLSADRLAPQVESTVYRIVQEALTNVGKHADAERVTVDVGGEARTVAICVADDGRGFDVATRTDGRGLTGMRERVELVGGELAVESSSGRGTALRARVPATPSLPLSSQVTPRVGG